MKLNKALQEQVKDSEDKGGFEPIPEGIYGARLLSVTLGDGPKGAYWKWEFEVDEGGDYDKRRLWNNTSLSPQSAWKLAESFKAFGVGPDTDTDDLCGQSVNLVVVQEVMKGGKLKGQLGNSISRVIPAGTTDLDDEDEPF